MEKEVVKGGPQWARFEDWLSSVAGKHNDRTVVAEYKDDSKDENEQFTESKTTLSYLARNRRETAEVFDHDVWDVAFGQDNVRIEEADKGIACYEDQGDDAARVFVTLKEAIGPYPSTWKLWPTFENYFGLRSDEEGNLVDPYTGDVVVEIPHQAEQGPVRVRTDYLQDYLSARDMVLIRQHDHRRFWLDHIQTLPESESSGSIRKEKWGCYSLHIANSKTSSMERFSRLLAKDLVTPFERAGTVGGKRASELPIEEYPEFMVGIGLDGKKQYQRPDPNPPNSLTPTYFSPKVLKWYYDEPSRYTVEFFTPGTGSVHFLDRWVIPFGRNEEGLIIVWLGDMAKSGLSYEEIVHWRTHNVSPRGGMAEDFWNAQMMCNPSDIPSLQNRLTECRSAIVGAIESRGEKIYKPYSGPDRWTEKSLRIPLFDEHGEFRETILLLSRMFIEYLDIQSFESDLPDQFTRDKEGKGLGPIVLFSNWLEHTIGVQTNIAEGIKRALQMVQMVRSKVGAAHRFSDASYQEAIRELGLSGKITAERLYCSVAKPLAERLEELCRALGVENQLSWIKYANT